MEKLNLFYVIPSLRHVALDTYEHGNALELCTTVPDADALHFGSSNLRALLE